MSNPTDTERLDFLIRMHYVPAKWRQWNPGGTGEPRPSPNGMVFLGWGGRAEIDAAMARSEKACSLPPPTQS